MKRRNAESGKMRRPVKRNKITEGIYGSTLLYVKFVLLWAMVIFADYMMEFRFEFLWPFWMMVRSIYDSFKYQGFAFSVFFICIALTSDTICFFFIPVQWLFFAASTYVWVQYVWYTDKGICLPTVALCAALVYVEAGVGVRREAGRGGGGGAGPGQLDLCRPFAAHCVGYPVVTLGFGVKSYVGHRMRLRKQREVQKENTFYYQLLKQALPEPVNEQPAIKDSSGDKTLAIANGSIDKIELESKHMNGHAVQATKSKKFEKELKNSEGSRSNHSHDESPSQSSGRAEKHPSNHNHTVKDKENNYNKANHNHHSVTGAKAGGNNHSQSNGVGHHGNAEQTDDKWRQLRQQSGERQSHSAQEKNSRNEYKQNDSLVLDNSVNSEKSKGTKNNPKGEKRENSSNVQREERRKNKKDTSDKEKIPQCKEKENNSKDPDISSDSHTTSTAASKDPSVNTSHDRIAKEKDRSERERDRCAERERECASELRRARASEVELRKALAASAAHERQRRQDNQILKQTNEELMAKVASLTSLRDWERTASERRVSEERRARLAAEARAAEARAAESRAAEARAVEARAAEAQAAGARQQQQQRKTGECGGEWCRARRAAAEADEAGLRGELQRSREHLAKLTRELNTSKHQVMELESRCRSSSAASRSASATSEQGQEQLAALHERAAHLEISLSAETRIKLDLFSALGEAKRQLQIREVLVRQQDREINELKAKITQLLAVMPCDLSVSAGGESTMLLASPARPAHTAHLPCPASLDDQNNSSLDPNASVYTPMAPAANTG